MNVFAFPRIYEIKFMFKRPTILAFYDLYTYYVHDYNCINHKSKKVQTNFPGGLLLRKTRLLSRTRLIFVHHVTSISPLFQNGGRPINWSPRTSVPSPIMLIKIYQFYEVEQFSPILKVEQYSLMKLTKTDRGRAHITYSRIGRGGFSK